MSELRSQPIRRRSLHDELVERLRDMILEGDLAAGQRVPEKDLCTQLAVSRTPLREALKVLASEGLLELLPNRGAVVTEMTARDIEVTFPVLANIERMAGELAAARITESEIAAIRALHEEMVEHYRRGDRPQYFALNQQIHNAIVRAADNEVLADVHRNLSLRVRRARYSANLSSERWREAVDEHAAFLEALEAHDPARLSALLKDHIEQKALLVLDWLRTAETEAFRREGAKRAAAQ